MSGTIDREWVFADVTPDEPCGPDLEYDPDFAKLADILKFRADQQRGDVILRAEDPDWAEARQTAVGLLQRTKDLRILVSLCRVLPHTDGWAAFADGLAVISALLQERWQDLHPLLDEEDRQDPSHRTNVLVDLAGPRTLERMSRVPLVGSAAGSPSLHDVRRARGEISGEWHDEEMDAGAVEQALASFSDSDREAARRDLRQARSEVWGIRAVFFDQSEGVRDLPLGDLLVLLLRAERALG